ncbi:hypothetical protein NP493_44g07053 [Ridgeia piscesae]|uniref:Uncharacterized protein n=1 Tax=Ridgeia piscesae TaxID=27915 RepID=A0AAD9PBT0_RIDPI|nr:hypothetical protein NP493_44g07053 [Ridgeia piscesae]
MPDHRYRDCHLTISLYIIQISEWNLVICFVKIPYKWLSLYIILCLLLQLQTLSLVNNLIEVCLLLHKLLFRTLAGTTMFYPRSLSFWLMGTKLYHPVSC